MPAVPLALAREGDHPVAEALALAVLGLVACVAGDRVGAVQLARQAEQITAGRHGPLARVCGHILTTVLIEAGDLAAAERVCTAGLAGARDAGDLWSLGNLLEKMVVLDLGRAVTRTPPRTCGKDSRPRCRPAYGPGCSTTWTAAGTCAP